MLWPDQQHLWIWAYDLWNFAYAYNALGERAWYVFPVLFAPTLASLTFSKGAWLQNRANTLAINNIFMFTFPAFFVTSDWAVGSSHNPAAYWTLSIIAFVFNVGLFIYHIYRIVKYKRNPLTQEIYFDTKEYKEIYEIEEKLAAKYGTGDKTAESPAV